MKKILICACLTCCFLLYGTSNLSAQNQVAKKNDKEYKLTQKTTIKKVKKMNFEQIVELIPTHLQKDLVSAYNSKDNYDKEKMLNSLKLMTTRHIKNSK